MRIEKLIELIEQTESNLVKIKKYLITELKKPNGGVKAEKVTGLSRNNFYNFIQGRSNMSWEKILEIAKKMAK
jgi:hypothetical protein